jgi:hypothetical protein
MSSLSGAAMEGRRAIISTALRGYAFAWQRTADPRERKTNIPARGSIEALAGMTV